MPGCSQNTASNGLQERTRFAHAAPSNGHSARSRQAQPSCAAVRRSRQAQSQNPQLANSTKPNELHAKGFHARDGVLARVRVFATMTHPRTVILRAAVRRSRRIHSLRSRQSRTSSTNTVSFHAKESLQPRSSLCNHDTSSNGHSVRSSQAQSRNPQLAISAKPNELHVRFVMSPDAVMSPKRRNLVPVGLRSLPAAPCGSLRSR